MSLRGGPLLPAAAPPAAALLLAASCAGAGAGSARQDDPCAGHRLGAARELAAWAAAPAAAPAAGAPLPLGRRVRLALGPGEGPGEGPPFRGGAVLEVPEDGDYGVSAGARLWIDVADPRGGAPLPPLAHGMAAPGCPVLKTVVFRLVAGRAYALRLSRAPARSAEVLVLKR